jgi:hypothetical protein
MRSDRFRLEQQGGIESGDGNAIAAEGGLDSAVSSRHRRLIPPVPEHRVGTGLIDQLP